MTILNIKLSRKPKPKKTLIVGKDIQPANAQTADKQSHRLPYTDALYSPPTAWQPPAQSTPRLPIDASPRPSASPKPAAKTDTDVTQDSAYQDLEQQLDQAQAEKWAFRNRCPNANHTHSNYWQQMNRRVEAARRRLHEYKQFGYTLTELPDLPPEPVIADSLLTEEC